MRNKLREIYTWMMEPNNADMAVGIGMLVVAGFMLGVSVAQ